MRKLRFLGVTQRVILAAAASFLLVFFVSNYFENKQIPVDAESEKDVIKLDNKKLFRLFNKMGEFGTTQATLHSLLEREGDLFSAAILGPLNISDTTSSGGSKQKYIGSHRKSHVPDVNLVLIACGSRTEQAITMLRSALMMSRDININIIAFVDNDFPHEFGTKILQLKWIMNSIGVDFRIEFQRTWFPAYKYEIWRNMWQPCATQRLFFPKLLSTYDSVLFVDSDVLFLSSVSEYWAYLAKMDNFQLTTVVANDELPGNGWYNIHSQVASFGPRGLNAGIMLMNLTRMREFNFVEKCIRIYEEFEKDIYLADQDILNILYSVHPELALEIPCSYNFRATHCDCEHDSFAREDCKCVAAMTHGISLIHGNLGSFHSGEYPFMMSIYEAFNKWNVVNISCSKFVKTLKEHYQEETKGANPCFGLTSDMIFGKMDTYCKHIELSKK